MARYSVPAHISLAQKLCGHLIDGEIVLVRGARRSGKTAIAELVRTELHGLGVPVSVLSGVDQSPPAVDDDLKQALAANGSAALIVDDLQALLAHSVGQSLHSRLTALCVDSPNASAIGVLLLCTPGDNVSRSDSARGSPIADAANHELTISILEYSELVGCIQQTPQLGARAGSAVEAYGGDLNLLGLAGADANGNAPRPAIAEAVLRAVSFMTPAAAARVVALARKAERGLASVADDHEIGPIAYLRDGRTLIGSAFVKDGLVELVAGGSPNWPSAISAAARRFQARIHDRPESLWFDRYLGVGITALQQFLATVANLGYVGRLHLLSSQKGIASISPTEKAAFETAAQGWIRKGMVVDWRLISPADWAPLHDRQLVSMGRIDGYSLPPADRVVCATPAGNEVDRYLPLAPVSLLNDAWRNAASYIP